MFCDRVPSVFSCFILRYVDRSKIVTIVSVEKKYNKQKINNDDNILRYSSSIVTIELIFSGRHNTLFLFGVRLR